MINKEKGYDIFTADFSEFYIPNVLHVERIDELMMFKNDDEACIQAEKDGVKFIYNMDFVPDRVYIDTDKNRQIIKEMLDKYPEYRVV